MKIAVTGHRPHKLNKEYDLQGPYSDYIRQEIRKILLKHQSTLVQAISGMALGVDTLFALEALDLKIPLLAALPFQGQEGKWPYKSQKLYNSILENPLTTTHIVCEGGYNSAKMQIRNEYMVDALAQPDSKLISIWDGSSGGTMNCVRYAEKQGTTIIRINPDGWRKEEHNVQPSLFS